MNLSGYLVYLAWLCEKLVNALVRPVWGHYLEAGIDYDADGKVIQSERAALYFRRFDRLVSTGNFWPCAIEWHARGELYIEAGGPGTDSAWLFED